MSEEGAPPATWVTLGRVAGMHGVRGWLRIYSHTDPRNGILDYAHWWLGAGGERREYALIEGRAQGQSIVARLDGIDDRDRARDLLGDDIAVPRTALAPTEGYYWADLTGLAVENRDGVALGRVIGYVETGGHDVMVVNDGEREHLIPWAPGLYVDEVMIAEGRLVVDWNPED